jgi:hypothetical protein
MRSRQNLNLPVAQPEFVQLDEQTMRRTVEQGYTDLRLDVEEIQDKKSSAESLALRRHQFLLMGAT